MSGLKRVMMAFVILSIFFKQLKNCFFHLLKVKNLWCFYPNNSFFFFAAKKIKVKIEIKKHSYKKNGMWKVQEFDRLICQFTTLNDLLLFLLNTLNIQSRDWKYCYCKQEKKECCYVKYQGFLLIMNMICTKTFLIK